MRLFKQLLAMAALVPGLAFAQAPIKVGIANDLSGPFAALGAEARDGFNLAIKQIPTHKSRYITFIFLSRGYRS